MNRILRIAAEAVKIHQDYRCSYIEAIDIATAIYEEGLNEDYR